MSAATAAARQAAPHVEQFAFGTAELSRATGLSVTALQHKYRHRLVAYLHLSARCYRVLEGDLPPLGDVKAARASADGTTGLNTLANAFRGRTGLSLRECATGVGVTLRTIQRAAEEGRLPVAFDELGRRLVKRADFIAWLRACRVPARWEVTK